MDLYALVEDRYLQEIPMDPITQSRDTWIQEAADLGEGDISQEPGIGYVRSGAEGSDINGIAYSEY